MAPKRKRGQSPSAPSSTPKRRTTTTPAANTAASGSLPASCAPLPPAPAVAPAVAANAISGNGGIGAESDPVLRTFGSLMEGGHYALTGGDVGTKTLKSRYHVRRQLANMATRPEGYEFLHHVFGSAPQTVTLLSPPHLVAVRDANGAWRRVPRDVATHGPQPYTPQWYNQYLRDNNLPSWFLSAGHIEMLTVSQEADIMGIDHNTATPSTSEHYLEVRYPERPQFPKSVSSGNQSFLYQLSEDEQAHLARNFPATNVLGQERRIIVDPSGYIQIHHDPSSLQLPQISPQLVAWVDAPLQAGSYVVQPLAIPPSTGVPRPNNDESKDRASAIGRVQRNGNPQDHCHCNGTFYYITEIDRRNAEILDFSDAAHVEQRIAQGALRRGLPQDSTPPVVIIWFPEVENGIVDPAVQPAGPGHWHYTSPQSQDLAEINLGDQGWAGAHLHGNHYPTAADVWLVRKSHNRINRDGNVADPTVAVNIVWVPDASTTNNEGVIVLSDNEFYDSDPVKRVEEDRGFGIDPVSGLAHWPPNDGIPVHDQTAHDGRGQYQTRMVGKKNFIKKITLDVARARPTVDHNGNPNGNAPQPHRTYIYFKGGRWERWNDAPSLDAPGGWDNAQLVEKLNRWAEQTRIRQDWKPKRGNARERYTSEQKKWIWEQVKDKQISYKQIADVFNKHFKLRGNLKRDDSGINSLVGRLKIDMAKMAAGVKDVQWIGVKRHAEDSKAEGVGKVEPDVDDGVAAGTEQAEQIERNGNGGGQEQKDEHGGNSDMDAPHELHDEA